MNTPNNLAEGACQVGKWEGWKMRQKRKWQRRVAATLFGKHTQWFWRKYLTETAEGNWVGQGDTFNSRWYWLEEAFWCHICGSDDMALEYFVRVFFLNYRSKKWNHGS